MDNNQDNNQRLDDVEIELKKLYGLIRINNSQIDNIKNNEVVNCINIYKELIKINRKIDDLNKTIINLNIDKLNNFFDDNENKI